jgi:hypothetical protein
LPVLVFAHVAVWGGVVLWMPPASLYGDIGRFVQIAAHPGIPYRDFPVEFPPLQTLVIESLLRADVGQAAVRVALVSIVCDLAIAWLLARSWSQPIAARYLILSLPLQIFMPFRLDYLPTVLAVAGAAVLRDRGDRALGGGLLATAAALKLWPAVLGVSLFRGRRALTGFIAIALMAAAVWWIVGGSDGPVQVATFRGSDGWHTESTVGATWWLVTATEPFREGGALRIGSTSTPAVGVAAIVYVALAVAVGMRMHRVEGDRDPAGFPSIALVASLIAVSPLASPQYLAWLAPWCAIAAPPRSSRAIDALLLAAGTLASASFLVYWRIIGDVADLRIPSFLRAMCVVTIAVVALVHTFRDAATSGDGGITTP